jgi:GntR family phosphonate transport system transcriptional regulator
MQLDRKGGAPLWRQLSQTLADEIDRGVFGAGQQLPTEPALMQRFGVSRDTVRRAMARLEQRGLIRVEQGRGTYVHDTAITYPLSRRTRFSENLLKQGREPRSQLVSVAEQAAGAEIALMLELRPADRVVCIRTVGYADDVPVNTGESYFPCARFPELAAYRESHDVGPTALYAAYGIADYLRLKTWISVRLPTAEEARHLRQPRSLPVLVSQKIDVAAAGGRIGYSSAAWAGERVTFTIENPID